MPGRYLVHSTFNKYLNKGVNDSIFTHNVRLLIANTVKDIWVTEFHFDCSRPPLTLGCANWTPGLFYFQFKVNVYHLSKVGVIILIMISKIVSPPWLFYIDEFILKRLRGHLQTFYKFTDLTTQQTPPIQRQIISQNAFHNSYLHKEISVF